MNKITLVTKSGTKVIEAKQVLIITLEDGNIGVHSECSQAFLEAIQENKIIQQTIAARSKELDRLYPGSRIGVKPPRGE